MPIIIDQDLHITSAMSFQEDVQVAAGVTITIGPGGSLDMNGREMLLYGTLAFEGTAASFALLKNGTISTDNTSGAITGAYAELRHVEIDDFFSEGSITLASSYFNQSTVDPLPSTSITDSLFVGTPVDISSAGASSVSFSKTTFIDSPVDVTAWTTALMWSRDSIRFDQVNFASSTAGNVLTLDPFFNGPDMVHPVVVSDSYIALPEGQTIDSRIYDANDDLRVSTDIQPSSFTPMPYLNDGGSFSVGSVTVSRTELGFTLASYGNTHFGTDAIDTRTIVGSSHDYRVVVDEADSVHLTAVQGGATLIYIDIERLAFQDTHMAFDIDGVAGQAYRIYEAVFNRAPDVAGLGYWISEMDQGMGLIDVAKGFVHSAEFHELFGTNPSNELFLGALYRNILDRAPEQGGYDYWLGELQNGLDKAQIVANFSESAENQANVIGQIQNGIEYQPWMA